MLPDEHVMIIGNQKPSGVRKNATIITEVGNYKEFTIPVRNAII